MLRVYHLTLDSCCFKHLDSAANRQWLLWLPLLLSLRIESVSSSTLQLFQSLYSFEVIQGVMLDWYQFSLRHMII